MFLITSWLSVHLGSPGQRAVKWVCVCVCGYALMSVLFCSLAVLDLRVVINKILITHLCLVMCIILFVNCSLHRQQRHRLQFTVAHVRRGVALTKMFKCCTTLLI